VSQRKKSVPSEKAKIGSPAAPLDTYISAPALAAEASGAFATVYVAGTTVDCETSGPEKVVVPIGNSLCTVALYSLCKVRWVVTCLYS